MKRKRILIMSMIIALIIAGCSNREIESPTSSEITTEAATETSSETVKTTQAQSDHVIVRSESTIKNDAKTNSIITMQESYQIGTYIALSIYADKEVPSEVFDDLFNKIDYYEYMVSKNIAETQLTKINENAGISPVKIDDELFDMIKVGLKYANISGGLFDISIGPLVGLWGIGTDHVKLPNDSEIKSAMALIDFTKIVMDEKEKTIYLPEKDMSIDLGALAKGYIADHVKRLIQAEGYTSAIINLGGNVLTVGKKPNSDTWSIGVRDPKSDAGTTMGILKLVDNSIVSSGIYERFFIEGGIRYHHIINPKTGYPEQNDMMSVSIVSEFSVDGDALSTTVFLLGLQKGMELVESLDNTEAVFIMADNSVYITSGLSEKFILTNNEYEIKSVK